MSTGELAGQVAVVAGGGRGIGRAIAAGFARAGAHVVVAARTAADLDSLVRELATDGATATAVPTDLTSESDVEALFARVDELGRLDVVVLNAGALPARGPLVDCSLAEWRATLDINLTAHFLCARAAAPRLRSGGGGRVIVTGSGMGHKGHPDYAAYACAKAAQWMLVRVLAQELAPDGIAVNELVPGPVDTSIGSGTFDSSRFPQEWAKTPEDVVPLALLLATFPSAGPSAQSFSLLRRDL